jgi:Spy/CpxP family protein refolding chaperone
MMKKLRFKTAMVLFLGIFLCSTAMAYGPHGSEKNGFENPMKSFVNYILGITDEQVADLAALKTETREAIVPIFTQMKDLTIEEALLAEVVDTVQAEAQFVLRSGINAQISDIKFDAALAGAKILTADQRGRILIFATFFIDIAKYIMDFPGLDTLKDLHDTYSRPDFGKDRYSYGAHGDHDFIQLTDEQKAALKDLKDETSDQIKLLIPELITASIEMIPLLLAQTIEDSAAAAKQDSIDSIKSQIAAIGSAAAIEGAQILTAEQRLAITEKMQEREQKIEDWGNGDHEGCPYQNK